MEAQYHQFPPETAENTSVILQKGIKNIVVYVLYAILLLLLFILLLVTGVKFSQLSKDVNEIKVQLAQPNRHHFVSSHALTENDARLVLLTAITPVRGKCREGWTFYENSCYYLSTTKKTWSAAEKQCQDLQGHLLVINKVEELDYISKIAPLMENYWIGLVERHNEGHWSWVDGSEYNSVQTFWDRGQPDDYNYTEDGEDCGQIHAAAERKRRLWNDADCSFTYRYICESKI